MIENSIKLVVNDKNDRGYSHVALMISMSGNKETDCGALYLSEQELDLLSNSLRDGLPENAGAFEVEDLTLVLEDY